METLAVMKFQGWETPLMVTGRGVWPYVCIGEPLAAMSLVVVGGAPGMAWDLGRRDLQAPVSTRKRIFVRRSTSHRTAGAWSPTAAVGYRGGGGPLQVQGFWQFLAYWAYLV